MSQQNTIEKHGAISCISEQGFRNYTLIIRTRQTSGDNVKRKRKGKDNYSLLFGGFQ